MSTIHIGIRFSLWGLLILTISSLSVPSNAATGKIPVIRIDTQHKNAVEIGLEIGQQSKALFPDIERRYDKHLATQLKQNVFENIRRTRLPTLVQTLEPAYQQELEGIAAVWSISTHNRLGDGLLSMDEFLVLNLLPDIGLSPDGVGFGVLKKASSTTTPIIGRNLDWSSTPELRSLQAITVYQKGNKKQKNDNQVWANIGFAGIISALSGFNQQQVFAAHINAEPYSPYKRHQRLNANTTSTVFALRHVLETSQSAQQASRYLASNRYAFSHSTLIADKTTLQVAEYSSPTNKTHIRYAHSPTRSNKRWNNQQQIAVIDCHVLATLRNNCNDAKDSYRWKQLHQQAKFNTTTPANVRDIAAILFDTSNYLFEIFNAKTLQSMIYAPEKTSLYLYTTPTNDITQTLPQHKAYLNLIPSELQQQKQNNNGYGMWLIGGLLLVLIGLMSWVRYKNHQQHATIPPP